MARTSNKKVALQVSSRKDKQSSNKKKGGRSGSGHQLCKRCSRRFGSNACAKRLCGSCCPLSASGAGQRSPCVAHLSLRRAAKRRQGAYLLVESVNRLKREESSGKKADKSNKLKTNKRLAKRLKQLHSTAEECDDHGDIAEEDADELEIVAQDDHDHDVSAGSWCDAGGAATLEAVVAMQAEEIARLRRELKHTRHAHERLKRKRVKVEQGFCILCEERGLNVLLVPCGHCYCRECVDPLRSCPVCRANIELRHNYHPPAYVCDDAVLNMMPAPLPSTSSSFNPRPASRDDEDDGDDEFVLRRRSAANPHRILFV